MSFSKETRKMSKFGYFPSVFAPLYSKASVKPTYKLKSPKMRSTLIIYWALLEMKKSLELIAEEI